MLRYPGCARASVWAAVFASAALLFATAAPAAPDVRIITYSKVPAAELDNDFLAAAFTMRLRQWRDGTPMRVFVLPDRDPVHEAFCRERLNTYPYVLRNLWSRLVFTGTGFAPVTVQSEDEMRQRVRSTPGAIGYVRSRPEGPKVEVVPPEAAP